MKKYDAIGGMGIDVIDRVGQINQFFYQMQRVNKENKVLQR